MSICLGEEIPHVDSQKEFYYHKLKKIAEDLQADTAFYEGLLEYIVRSEFPGPVLLDRLVLRDCVSGEEIFPTKESVLTYLREKVVKLKRGRDAHNRLAQIVLRAEAEEEIHVEAEEVQVVDPPEQLPVEVIDVDSSSIYSFDTQ